MHLTLQRETKEALKPKHGHQSVVPSKKVSHATNQTKAHRYRSQNQEDSLPSPHTALATSTGQANPSQVDTKATQITSSHQDTRTQTTQHQPCGQHKHRDPNV